MVKIVKESDLREVKQIVGALRKENNKDALKWLKTCLENEKENRNDTYDENLEEVLMIPTNEKVSAAMKRVSFINFLQFLQFVPPTEEKNHWKISKNHVASSLEDLSISIENIISDDLKKKTLKF